MTRYDPRRTSGPEVETEKDFQRALPPEQDKGLDEEEAENAQIRAMEDAEEVAEYFGKIETATRENGDVLKASLKSIDTTTGHNTVVVEVDIPSDSDTTDFRLTSPKIWNERYEFVRFVEKYGYRADDFHKMIEADIDVEVIYENNEYELAIPEYDAGILERWKTWLEARDGMLVWLTGTAVILGGTNLITNSLAFYSAEASFELIPLALFFLLSFLVVVLWTGMTNDLGLTDL